MWLSWIVGQYTTRALTRLQPEKVTIVIRDKDGREFSPFSIEWRDTGTHSELILCENEEQVDD